MPRRWPAATTSAAWNAVGASTFPPEVVVGPSASINAGQRLGNDPPQPGIVVATGVATDVAVGGAASALGFGVGRVATSAAAKLAASGASSAGNSGSGSAAGVLEASASSRSVGAINSWNAKRGVEFVFSPGSGRFAMGRPAPSAGLTGSPHQQLAQAIGADADTVVGGILNRGSNGALVWNEQSGQFWENWTPTNRGSS